MSVLPELGSDRVTKSPGYYEPTGFGVQLSKNDYLMSFLRDYSSDRVTKSPGHWNENALNYMKKILYLYAILLFSACSVTLLSPVQSDVDRGAAKFPGLSLADLQQGKSLYEANCGKCHGLKKPESRDEAAWREIMPPMAKKAKINDKEQQLILQYVVTMSDATRESPIQ
jgi:hypothetical protein